MHTESEVEPDLDCYPSNEPRKPRDSFMQFFSGPPDALGGAAFIPRGLSFWTV